MKVAVLILLLAVYCVQSRKIYKPIDKNANVDFINMESGGMGHKPVVEPMKPAVPVGPKPPAKPPVQAPVAKPTPPTVAPVAPAVKPAPPQPPKPAPPTQNPGQIKPVPVNPPPATNPITTPGPGSVKSLINFYDSQGKASPIRPYSYSEAVKQG